jgi:hypothetical protein
LALGNVKDVPHCLGGWRTWERTRHFLNPDAMIV